MSGFHARLDHLAPVKPKGEEEPSWKLTLIIRPPVPLEELVPLLYTQAGFEIVNGQLPLNGEGPVQEALIPPDYPYHCESCGGSFNTLGGLQEHRRHVHGEKP